jgi:glycerophosphoryl diester phosphodiesterase
MAVAAEARRFVPANRFLAAKAGPLVVGHRGVPVLHQENTLAGFRRAVSLGLDAIELDVRLTRDGRAVVFHDANAERLTGVRRAISDLTWDEVSGLRVVTQGKYVQYERAERIPLLAEVLAEIGDAIAINIELKPRWFGDDIAAVATADIAAAGLTDRVLVTSSDARRLREAGRADVAIGYCWNDSLFSIGGRVLDRLLAAPPQLRALCVEHTLVGADLVRRLVDANVAVGAHVLFPLDGRSRSAMADREVERMVALGVDWIESDDPERLQRVLARRFG